MHERADRPDSAAELVRIVNNSWRSRILAEVCRRDLSPTRFVAEVGGELSTISRHFRWLEDSGYLEIAREDRRGRRRGAAEHIFRSTQPRRLDTPSWQGLPLHTREIWSRNAVAVYFRQVVDAVGAGTFDSMGDRHFSWDALTLDHRAWTEVTDRLDEVLDWLVELAAESERRLRASGGEAIPTTVGLSAFLSPSSTPLRG